MDNFKQFVTDNWRSKLISLFISIAIWYLIKSHLETDSKSFPVPGTSTPIPTRPGTGPILDDTLLGPLIPPPAPIPVPGGDVKG